MNIPKNLREIVKKVKGLNDKDKVINIIFICIIGIALVFASNYFQDSTVSQNDVEDEISQETITLNESVDYQENLQSELKYILGQIDGVGNVEVLITFRSVEEKEVAYNTSETNSITSESDNQGGQRITEQSSVDEDAIMVNENGNNSPVVITENYPEVKGVIIVAQGAADPQVKYKLMKGVENALDLPAHKVMVYAKKK
ncbi:MAG: stage III sporulation protein AG [Eubacteriaceae bacterium]